MRRIFTLFIISLTAYITGFASSPFELKEKATALMRNHDYNSAIDTLNEAIYKYKKLSDLDGLSRCYNNLGLILWLMKDSVSSVKYYDLARQNAAKVSLDLLSKINSNIGSQFLESLDYNMARNYFLQNTTQKFAGHDQIVNESMLYVAYADIHLGKFEEANSNLSKSVQYYESIRDTKTVTAIENLSILSNVFQGKNDPKIVEMINNIDLSVNPKLNIEIAGYYSRKGNYNMSNLILLNLNECKTDTAAQFQLHFLLAKNYLKMNMPILAKSELEPLKLKVKNEDIESKLAFFELMSEIYKAEKNFTELRYYDSLRNDAKDEQMLLEKQRMTNLMENLFVAKYQIKSLDTRILNYEKELLIHRIYLLVLATVLLLIVVSIFVIRSYKKSKSLLNALLRETAKPNQV